MAFRGTAMDFQFNAEEWAKLPKEERIRRCKAMADEARKLASTCTGTMNATYHALAKDWENLAFEIEQN